MVDTQPTRRAGEGFRLDLSAMGLRAFLFDLDGVITRTADLHAEAWRRLFDPLLAERAAGGPYVPFRLPQDYVDFVDGKPRYEGVQSFLSSRGIHLPFGAVTDTPGNDTICALGNAKNSLFAEVLSNQGVRVFDSTVRFVDALRERKIKTACVSSSKNCRIVLHRTGLTELFEVIYDGVDLEQDALPGKPDPASFLKASTLLGVEAAHAAVVEDAVAGVQAGRSGGFGLVIGVDRGAGHDALRAAGAGLVVADLGDIRV